MNLRLFVLVTISFCTTFGAYTLGYTLGNEAGTTKSETKHAKEVVSLTVRYAENVVLAFNRGVESSNFERDLQTRVERSTCKMEIDNSYLLGKKDGIKRIGKLREIKTK